MQTKEQIIEEINELRAKQLKLLGKLELLTEQESFKQKKNDTKTDKEV